MRSPRLLLWLALCAVVSSPASAEGGLDPAKKLSQYAFDRWDLEKGLPSLRIYDLAQTPDGYLWLATGDGLVRFDGLRFTPIPALAGDDVYALHTGSDGRLRIGLSDGSLLIRDEKELKHVIEPDPQAENAIMTLFEDREGHLWLWWELEGPRRYRVAGQKLIEFQDARLAGLTFPPQQIPRRSIHQDREGNLWLASQGRGVYVLREQELQVLTTADGLADDFAHVVAGGADGSVWIGTRTGLHRYSSGRLTDVIDLLGTGTEGTVHELLLDRNRSLWVARRDISRLAGKPTPDLWEPRVETLEIEGEFAGEARFFEDREGSLWIARIGDGLFRLRPDAVTPIGPPEGLPDDFILTVFEDRDRRLWIGTSHQGVIVLDGDAVSRYTATDGLPHQRIWSIHQSKTSGEMWLGTDGGLVRWAGAPVRVFTTADGLTSDRVRIVLEDPQEPETFWIGTIDGGLNRWRHGSFTSWTMEDGLANDNVRWLHKDRHGDLWIGLQNGLNRLRDDQLEAFGKEDGLASTRIRFIHEDDDGTIWIGTTGGGLSRYREGSFASYARKDGLVADDVWGILEDGDGYLWLSGPGASRVAKQSFEAYDAGRIPGLAAEDVDSPAFARTRCCNAGGFPSAWRGHDGRLWYPGVRGVVAVEPEKLRDRDMLPPTVIESILVDGQAVPQGGMLEVPPGKHHLEFHYSCPSLTTAQRLSYRHRLVNLDAQWIEAGPRRVAYYSHLAPGHYELRVAAHDGMGPWSPPAVIPITVLPFWWQTYWFRGSAVLLLVAFAAIWYRTRLRKIEERHRVFRTEVDHRLSVEKALRKEMEGHAEAEAQLRDQRDQLTHVGRVAMMGELTAAFAHELNQPLTAIGTNALAAKRFMAEPDADLDEVREILDDIVADNQRAAEIIRRLRDLMKKQELKLELVDVNDLLRETVNLLRSDAILHDTALEMRLEQDLPRLMADRVHLQQVFMNLIRNGFEAMEQTPSAERRLVLRSEQVDGALRLSVRDYGDGFGGQDSETIFAPFSSSKPHGLGMGLSISRSIVESHDGRIRARENPDRGVIFELTFPLAPGSRRPP